jgi:hypothetical protein
VAGNDVIAEMASTCVLMRTRLISSVITGIYDEKLRPFGIGSAQFALLAVIYQIEPATRAKIGQQIIRTLEPMNAWSQNLGHTEMMTTFCIARDA